MERVSFIVRGSPNPPARHPRTFDAPGPSPKKHPVVALIERYGEIRVQHARSSNGVEDFESANIPLKVGMRLTFRPTDKAGDLRLSCRCGASA